MKPDIDYPGKWVFKVFGKDSDLLSETIAQIMPGSDYTLTPSHSSSHGRYHCLNLELTVVSDEDRISIYEALSAHKDILIVL